MTSYQKLKLKCEKLQEQVDLFKRALTVCTAPPKIEIVDDFKVCVKEFIAFTRNKIDKMYQIELTKWVAENLDKNTISMLLKIKEELQNEKND